MFIEQYLVPLHGVVKSFWDRGRLMLLAHLGPVNALRAQQLLDDLR